MKKLSDFLRKHCGALLAGTLAALLAFALGWYAHADYAAAQQEAKLCDQLRWLTEEGDDLQMQYEKRARTGELDTPINEGLLSADVVTLRGRAGIAHDLLVELNSLPAVRSHREAIPYLIFLNSHLLRTQYSDYHSLEELFIATKPFMDVSYTNLNEALDAIEANLMTEKGQAALAIVKNFD